MKGAAIATTVSRIIETAVIAAYVFKVDRKLRFTCHGIFSYERELLGDLLRNGLPIIGGNIVWSVNLMASTAILGRFSESVTTAVSIANTLNSLAFVTINGLSAAVGIITGRTVGSGMMEKMKEYARTVQILFLLVGILSGTAMCVLSGHFICLYKNISVNAAAYSGQFITVLSVTMIGTCYQAACLGGLVKAGGDVSFVFKNDTIFVFFVVLPSAIAAASMGAQAWVVFACLKCDQILKCFVAIVKINRFNWIKKLTRDDAPQFT